MKPVGVGASQHYISDSSTKPRTTGFGPTPRYGHTLTLTPDGRLLTIGGCSFEKDTGVPRYNNDVRQLDTESMIWTRPRLNGDIPTGRYGHSATLLSDGMVFLFGGWGKGGCQSNELINDATAFYVWWFRWTTSA
eukprot:gene21673-27714_t